MKRLIAIGIALVVIGAAAAPASGHAPGTKYYVGMGDRHHAKVAFRVAKGKVKDGIVDGKRLQCGKDYFDTFFFSFNRTKLDGSKFRQERRDEGGSSLWTGHVRGAAARGRLKVSSNGAATGICKTGVIRWKARTVSKQRWQNVNGFRPA